MEREPAWVLPAAEGSVNSTGVSGPQIAKVEACGTGLEIGELHGLAVWEDIEHFWVMERSEEVQ